MFSVASIKSPVIPKSCEKGKMGYMYRQKNPTFAAKKIKNGINFQFSIATFLPLLVARLTVNLASRH